MSTPGVDSRAAKLFRAAAEAEAVHAQAHLRAMDGVKSTSENLEVAIAGESDEFKEMYPKFLAQAQEEGNKPAEFSFKNALAVEKVHHSLYSKALESVKSGQDLSTAFIYVCSVCGNTVERETPQTCPVCGVPASKFSEIK
ncbi:MAG: rubrerythrin family protein [Candidatus Omnitrophica bacterium]|nr:rubrerythrin family protein [Candidatus Omnitrophota bacterium]